MVRRAARLSIDAVAGCLAMLLATPGLGCQLELGGSDHDLDGYRIPLDCDDDDANVHPDAGERCGNEIDDDCDGLVDEGEAVDLLAWFPDADGDGYGADATDELAYACSQPTGYVENGWDCDDADAEVHPGAGERCNGMDDDCDRQVDEAPSEGSITWYRDQDGDGYGETESSERECEASVGYVWRGGDCVDWGTYADWTFPGVAVQESTTLCMQDVDGDGWGDSFPASPDVEPGQDCDDLGETAPYTYPGAASIELPDECTRDVDGDGYGDAYPDSFAVTPGSDCCDDCPFAWVTYPGAAFEDSESACMKDYDGDGYGDQAPPSGSVEPGNDCDDGHPDVHPGREEHCDGVDEDCDGMVDDDPVDGPSWYLDADGDGYGSADSVVVACEPPVGWVGNGGDPDDESYYMPASCLEALELGYGSASGSYWLDPDGQDGSQSPMPVLCNMEYDGGGWTLVQRTVWDWSVTSALWSEYGSWLDLSVGDCTVDLACRVAGRLWIGFNDERDHLLVARARDEHSSEDCDPLHYVGTDGLLSVDETGATLSDMVSDVAIVSDSELSASDLGPASSCTEPPVHGVPWFHDAESCCETCPSLQDDAWKDQPHPSVLYLDEVADDQGLLVSDVCPSGDAQRSDSGFEAVNVLEYYLR